MDGPRGAVEHGVTEGEDAAVRCHLPVALAVGGGRHADDGLIEAPAARPAVEVGVTEGEGQAVGGHLPVAAAVGGGRHADDGRGQTQAAGRAVEGRTAHAEDPAVCVHQPFARGRAGPGRVRVWCGECRGRDNGQGVGDGEKRQSEDGQSPLSGPGRERACGSHDGNPPFPFLPGPLAGESLQQGNVGPRRVLRSSRAP